MSLDGYSIKAPNLLIIQEPLPTIPNTLQTRPFRLVSYPFQRQLPNVKTTDYIMAIWLKPWINQMNADDVLYHTGGLITECPRSNIFLITPENILVTPSNHILQGITRKKLLQFARNKGMITQERDVTLLEIKKAKEVFITSSTKRLIPVAQLDEHIFKGDSAHSITQQLYDIFYEEEQAYLQNNAS